MVDSIVNWSLEEKILSIKDLATFKIAIQMCNGAGLKTDILKRDKPGSDYYAKERYYDSCIKRWHKVVGQKAAIILEKLGLPKRLREKLVGLILSIGLRMLIWAEYHEAKVGFSRECSINVLTSSFFTLQGNINNKKAAEELLKDNSLSKKEQFKLACLYCLVKDIPDLFWQMSNEDKKTFYNAEDIEMPELIKFWSSYMTKANELNERISDQNMLRRANQEICRVAIRNIDKTAIEYCLDELKVNERNKFIVEAAEAAISKPEYWIPTEYYADTLFYLLSIMREDQQIELLKKDINKAKFDVCKKYIPRSLYYFLNWPYQNYFMKTAELMWGFLPGISFAVLLLMICDKIELTFKHYYYRKLLKEFWCQSPKYCKRYVFNNEHGYFKKLLERLFTLTVFTDEDRTNIDLILASASKKQKKLFFSLENSKDFCIHLIKNEKWGSLKEFISTWISSECFLPKREINELKKQRICSKFKRRSYLSLVPFFDSIRNLHNFLMQCNNLSKEERETIKYEFIFNSEGISKCEHYIYNDHFELLSEFIDSNLCSTWMVKKFIAYYNKCSFWKMLITGEEWTLLANSLEGIFTGIHNGKTHIAGKWEQVEKLLTWCFSSEAERIDFKKNHLFKLVGVNIISYLIASCRVQEAEKFLAWIGLSFEEIRELKLKALCSELGMAVINELLLDFEHRYNPDTFNRCYKGETYLKWCFIDIETLLEFKKMFDEEYGFKNLERRITEGRKNTLNRFYMFIERLVNDFTLKTEGRESKMSKKEFPEETLSDQILSNEILPDVIM